MGCVAAVLGRRGCVGAASLLLMLFALAASTSLSTARRSKYLPLPCSTPSRSLGVSGSGSRVGVSGSGSRVGVSGSGASMRRVLCVWLA